MSDNLDQIKLKSIEPHYAIAAIVQSPTEPPKVTLHNNQRVTLLKSLEPEHVVTGIVQTLPTTVDVKVVGIQGPPGSSDAFVFTQSTPANQWTINHNLGFIPSVTVYSVGGMEVEAEVIHISNNQCLVSFVTPFAGKARLI